MDVDSEGATASVDEVGDIITYQVVVTNTGNVDLNGVLLSDTLVPAVGSEAESITDNDILEIGESWTWTYTYSATQSDIDTNGGGSGYIQNTATVSTDEIADQSSSAAVPINQNPAYTIEKSVTDVDGAGATGHVDAAGDVIAYQIVITNTGNQTLTGVSVNDPLLGSLTGPTESLVIDGDLAVGETWTYTGSYTALQSDIDNNGGGDGDIDNTATVDCNQLDAETDSAEVILDQNASYTITKEVTDVDGGGPSAHADAAGDVIAYRISVENTGNTSLTGITLNDSLLGSLSVPSGDTTNPGTLDVGETWIYTGSYTVLQSDIDNNGGGDGDIDNTATVDCNELGAETDSAAVILDQNASYTITKEVTDVDGGGPSAHANEAGDVIDYRISVENTGNTSLTGVTLNDSLLGALSAPSGDNTNPGTLDVGETWVYIDSYTVLQSDIDNNGGGDGDIDNTATVDCNELDAETDSVAVILDQNPSYNIVKTVTDVGGGGPSGSVDAAGDVISYRISVENTGTQA